MDIKFNCGGTFIALLVVALIVLKLTGYINWSWGWVLAPVWIVIAFTIIVFLLVMLVLIVKELT